MKIELIKHLKRLTEMITERQKDGKFEREVKTHGIMKVSKTFNHVEERAGRIELKKITKSFLKWMKDTQEAPKF